LNLRSRTLGFPHPSIAANTFGQEQARALAMRAHRVQPGVVEHRAAQQMIALAITPMTLRRSAGRS
jgi:hypothetical protein